MMKKHSSRQYLASVLVSAATIAAAAHVYGANTLQRDAEFLLRYAPPQDLPLSGEYVTNNCVLAAAARETALE